MFRLRDLHVELVQLSHLAKTIERGVNVCRVTTKAIEMGSVAAESVGNVDMKNDIPLSR